MIAYQFSSISGSSVPGPKSMGVSGDAHPCMLSCQFYKIGKSYT